MGLRHGPPEELALACTAIVGYWWPQFLAELVLRSSDPLLLQDSILAF